MRVTMISRACIVGAYQTKLEAIASFADVELTVVLPATWRENGRTLRLERAHTTGYQLVVAPIAVNGSFHLHFFPTLPAILRATRPQICHIDEEPYNLATYLALRAARGLGAKGLFFTWQNIVREYPPPFSLMERYVHRHVEAAIAGNCEAADVLRGKGYSGPVRVIPQFGVDPQAFSPCDHKRASECVTIGYAGRLVPEKGLLVLADALVGLRGAWRFLVCGSGLLEEALRQRFAAEGLGDRVQFQSQVPSSEMPRHLASMDVLVLPSLTRPNWKEQFGRVLVEAMACGVPVVGSNSGEIAHVIGDAGLVVPEGDSLALREALEALISDRARREDLGARGRARVLENYTQASIAGQTVQLYRDMMNGSVSGGL